MEIIKKIIFIFILMFMSSAVFAGKLTWTEINGGENGNIKTVIQYNNRIIVGGGFTTAGGNFASNVAMWDPETGWSALGPGLNDTVYALIVFNNELYAAGRFTYSGANTANHIARWNGTYWANVGLGMNDIVRTMVVYNNQLIAGGNFTTAGGIASNRLAIWNGFFWQPLGSGTTNGVNNDVLSLAVFNGKIIAGGKFTVAGADSARYIASYNFGSWQPLGLGMNERVQALHIYNGQLIAGGNFTSAGGNTCNHIAAWNGLTWNPVNSGTDKPVLSLAVHNNELVIGGEFKYAGGVYVDRIAVWNNTTWRRLMTGMNSKVNSLLSWENVLYAGGEFTIAGGKYAKRIAFWKEMPTIVVSGIVRYQSNNQPVPSGKVKAVRIDVNTREIIYLDSAIINNGYYSLNEVPTDTVYVICFPSDELEDFVPTYYSSSIDWSTAVKIYSTTNLNNINILVYRTEEISADNAANISGYVYLNYNPLENGGPPYKSGAILYLKQGSYFRSFKISNSYEHYIFDNVPQGTYDMFVYRAGYTSAYRSVIVGSTNLDTINFYLDTIGLIGIKKISGEIPDGFRLGQNYPNPFNPATMINYQLAVRSNVKLVVYDAMGREIETLVDENMTPGTYEVMWNASRLSSGVYFYKLTAGNFSETKKMILIK